MRRPGARSVPMNKTVFSAVARSSHFSRLADSHARARHFKEKAYRKAWCATAPEVLRK